MRGELSPFAVDQIDDINFLLRIDGSSYLFHAPSLRIARIEPAVATSLSGSRDVTAPRDGADAACLEALRESGFLLPDSPSRLESYRRFDKATADCPVNTFLMNLAHSCNLGCTYCYAGKGSYLHQSGRSLMSTDVAVAAIDLFLDRLGGLQPSREPRIIDFFGGEPLCNYPVLRETVLYAEKRMRGLPRKIPFGITTNLTLMTDEMFDFLQEHDVRIMVSLDGDREVHDAHRRTRNGEGTYDAVVEKSRRYLALRPDLFMARATVTVDCVDYDRIARHLEEVGFREYNLAIDYCGCVDPLGGWTDELMQRYDEEYGRYIGRVYSEIVGGCRLLRASLFDDLDQLRRRERHVIPCQISRSILVVTPDGSLYPCQRLTEAAGCRIGSIAEGVDGEKRKSLYPRLVFEKRKCRTCWARYLCGGGCPSASRMESGTDENPDSWNCRARMTASKWLLWLYVKLKEAGIPLNALQRRGWLDSERTSP